MSEEATHYSTNAAASLDRAPPAPFTESDALAAWKCVRQNNSTIPDEALDAMRDVLLTVARTGAAQRALRSTDTIIVGASLCYGDDHWYREITAGGITFLVPLDQQEDGRHFLAARHAERAKATRPTGA